MIILQAQVLFFFTLVCWVMGAWQVGISFGLGGLVALIPNIYFAYRLHLTNGKNAQQIVRIFYATETKKIILTAALFVIVFQIREVNLLALLAGYIAVVSVHWFALVLWRS